MKFIRAVIVFVSLALAARVFVWSIESRIDDLASAMLMAFIFLLFAFGAGIAAAEAYGEKE